MNTGIRETNLQTKVKPGRKVLNTLRLISSIHGGFGSGNLRILHTNTLLNRNSHLSSSYFVLKKKPHNFAHM